MNPRARRQAIFLGATEPRAARTGRSRRRARRWQAKAGGWAFVFCFGRSDGRANTFWRKRRAGPVLRRELETNFDEFSACSDAETVFGSVVRVSVIVAPRDILLMIQMANDRHRDQNDGCADDESSTYQLFHLISSRLDPRKRGKTDTPEPSPRDMSYVTPLSQNIVSQNWLVNDAHGAPPWPGLTAIWANQSIARSRFGLPGTPRRNLCAPVTWVIGRSLLSELFHPRTVGQHDGRISDEQDDRNRIVRSHRRRFDPGRRRRMASLRHASPCRGSDRSLHNDDERKAAAQRALRGLFLRVQLSEFPSDCEPRSARSGAATLISAS